MSQHEPFPLETGRDEEEVGTGEQYDFDAGQSDMDPEERENLERFLESLQE